MSSTPSIEAVPTPYGRTVFRSRLEADWARTLDINGIAWEYEPETITLFSGVDYLPDFRLPDLGTWIEVKGPGVPRVEKAYELARNRACHCTAGCSCRWAGGELVLIGRESLRDDGPRRTRHGYTNWETAHGVNAHFATCPMCRRNQWIRLGRRPACRACAFPLHAATVMHRAVDRRLRFAEAADGVSQVFGGGVFPGESEWGTP